MAKKSFGTFKVGRSARTGRFMRVSKARKSPTAIVQTMRKRRRRK